MINGIHGLIYSKDAEADRAFFRDILGFPFVDAHGGWLIFALPPAEMGVHPIDEETKHELHFMCDDVHATRAALERKGVKFTCEVQDAGYGLVTEIRLPGGGALGLYEPRHASPLFPQKAAGAPKKAKAAAKPEPAAKASTRKPAPRKKKKAAKKR
jgi:catechol 2,3-dioxygenase-like lactoylglutathione lyase family enzyme